MRHVDVFHTHFIYIIYTRFTHTLRTLHRSHIWLGSYMHVYTYVCEEKNGNKGMK